MVVVNLYAFEKTAQRPGVSFADVIENIDIGGPSMVRSAAKNFSDVAIVTSAADYTLLADEMTANSGSLSRATRWRLAKAAFAITAAYDAGIATALESIEAPIGKAVFSEEQLPSTIRVIDPMLQPLRYGENPHQKAALYMDGSGRGVANARQLQGKELSYNNIVDLDACWELVSEFDEPAVVIIKHTNPCGASTGATVVEAYRRALESDPVSAFGGVIGVNREVDAAAAEEIAKLFVEAIVAPSFTPEALERFGAKKNLRLIEISPAETRRVLKQVSGGLLVQDADRLRISGGRSEDRHPAKAHGGGDACAALRLAGVQARQIERDRLCPIQRGPRPDGWGWRRADEPGGRRAVWCDEGDSSAQGDGCRIGRLFPVSRRPGDDCRGWRYSGHSARRLGPGRGGYRGCRPAWSCYDFYQCQALPARINAAFLRK